jgi:hypothetical protein
MNAKRVRLTGTLAALFAVSGSAVFAQDSAAKPSTTSAIIVDAYGDPVPLSAYQLLRKVKSYDAMDIQQARLEGFSYGQVATIAKIADLTGNPFSSISSQVLAGHTFADLASGYNLRYEDVLSAQDNRDQIKSYVTAYWTTGKNAVPIHVEPDRSAY